MQITQIAPTGRNLITAIEADSIAINGEVFRQSVLVHANGLFPHWPITDIAQLRLDHLDPLRDQDLEIVLLGTGAVQSFPSPEQWRELRLLPWGLEIMTTPAACRTYNLIAAEGRAVAAALIL